MARHGQELRYVELMERWYGWTGTRWRADPGGTAVMGRVVDTVRAAQKSARSAEDMRWIRTSQSLPRMKAAVTVAQSCENVVIGAEDLDRDPMLLGVANGTVDLRTGQIREADPADLITHASPVEYDPDAECPLWEQTMERILPDPHLRAFVQRCAGYTLTGRTEEQTMFVAYGRGANGKSVFIETLMGLMGGYAQKAPSELLMVKQSEATNDLAALRGARLAAVVETEDGRRLAESRVKELTGGDTITARFLHKEFFDFRPVAKLWLVTNHRPRITGTDDGIWRRIEESSIPFTEYIAPEERDKLLTVKLRREQPGILAWAVRGCLDWQERGGLGAPKRVLAAGRDYRAEQDVLGAFMAECCVTREGVSVAATELYRAYQDWCQANGHAPVSQTSFGIKLRERGYAKSKGRTITWHGVGLLARGEWPDDDPEGGDPDDDGPGDGPEAGGPDRPGPEHPGGAGDGVYPVQEYLDDLRTVCRACGQTCHPVNGGLHPTCDEPGTAPEDDGKAENPTQEPQEPQEPVSGPESPMVAPEQGQPPTEPVAPDSGVTSAASAAPVTRRLRRPWTPRETVYLTWSSGRGVAEGGTEFRVPGRSSVADLLPALPPTAQRVVLVGAMPGGSGPGLVEWATGDLPEQWGSGAHFLDPDALAARYKRPDGSPVDVHRLAAWTRDGASAKPEQAARAFALFRDGLVETFGAVRSKPGERSDEDPALLPVVLGSPASTGRELLLRALPSGHEYPVLDPAHLELLHHTTGQGRNELLTEPRGDELPSLYGYDMRWSYAALCRGVTGTGPATLDEVPEFAGYAPGRYEVEFTVPKDWSHVGLLPVHGEGFPAEPGSTWRTWADARELRLADRWGWKIADMRIHRRLLYTVDEAQSAPLRTWADKLVRLREEWLPEQDAPATVVNLARDFTRTTLLAGIGAMWGRRQRVTHSVHRDEAGQVPADAEAYLAGDRLVWTTETQASWREMVHPEWVSQIWAEQRCRLLDTGKSGRQPGAGALHLPHEQLVALRTDALYSTNDPGWSDPGTVGVFRRQVAIANPVPTPRTVEDLLALRES